MNLIKKIFIGFCLGVGAIVPGISSGVICVIFGIYEKLINSILNFFKHPITTIKFVFPLLLGGSIGFLCLGNILNKLLYMYPLQLKSIFIGLILGCIPSLFKEINKKEQFNKKYLLFFFISSIIGIFLVFFENYYSNILSINNNSIIYIIIC